MVEVTNLLPAIWRTVPLKRMVEVVAFLRFHGFAAIADPCLVFAVAVGAAGGAYIGRVLKLAY